MANVFLETTALIELVFADKATRNRIETLISDASARITSQYCVYEVHRGYLRYLRLLHNKSLLLERFSQIFGYLQAVRFRASYAGAITGSMEKYFQASQPKLSDQERLVHFRGYLRGAIRRGFRKIPTVFNGLTNNIGCRNAGPPYEDNRGLFQQDLQTRLCGKHTTCGLKEYAHTNMSDLEKIKDGLDSLADKDAETLERIKGLRELYRVRKRDFPKTACFRSSDALIAHEAPSDSPIVTKNRRHFEPICKILGKTGMYY